MNWARTLLDAVSMAAYFNIFALAIVYYNNRLMFPCYPKAIIKDAVVPPTREEKRFYWLWICFGMLIPMMIYGALSARSASMSGFWNLAISAYVQWNMVSLFDLIILDWVGITHMREKLTVPGTEGHPGYETKAWMLSYALPEHLIQWPLFMAPILAAIQAGLGMLIA